MLVLHTPDCITRGEERPRPACPKAGRGVGEEIVGGERGWRRFKNPNEENMGDTSTSLY